MSYSINITEGSVNLPCDTFAMFTYQMQYMYHECVLKEPYKYSSDYASFSKIVIYGLHDIMHLN